MALCQAPFSSPALAGGDEDYPGNEFVKARLVLEESAFVPGKASHLGVVFDIAKGWHLYWRNSGDSGMPPMVSFKMPDGVKIGEPQWPVPRRHVEAGMLVDYTFDKQLVLIFPVTISEQVAGQKKLPIGAEIEWLVCSDKCVHGKVNVKSEFDVATTASESRDAAIFREARASQPAPWTENPKAFSAVWRERELVIDAPGATRLVFFPYESEDNIYPEDMVKSGDVKGPRIRLTYPEKADTARSFGGVISITRDGKESFHEVKIVPTS